MKPKKFKVRVDVVYQYEYELESVHINNAEDIALRYLESHTVESFKKENKPFYSEILLNNIQPSDFYFKVKEPTP